MLDLVKLGSVPVTIYKKHCDKKIHLDMLKDLVKKGKSKVFSVHENPKTCKYLSSYFDLQYPEIKTQNLKDNNFSTDSDIYFSDFPSTRKILLENLGKKKVDFCSVFVINDIHFEHPEKMYFILLWLQIFKVSDSRPYLLITTDSYLIPEMPFELETDSLQEVEQEDNEIDIQYHNQDYSPNSSTLIDALVEVTSKLHSEKPVDDEKTSLWLLFYSGKKNINYLSKTLYDTIENSLVFSYKNIETFDKIMTKGKRTIIIIDEFYEDNIFLVPDGIIDGMVTENQNYDGRLYYTYSSKQHSEIKSSYLKQGFCYRLCTQELYESLPKTESSLFSKKNLDNYFLEVVSKKINPLDFFLPLLKKGDINRIVSNLTKINAITVDMKITKMGNLVRQFPLSPKNGMILIDWIKEEKPIFPMIVMLVIMEISYPLVKLSKKDTKNLNDEKKSEIVKNYYGIEYSTSIELYLKIFVMIISNERTINIKNYNYICKKYNLNYVSIKEIFDKVKKIVDLLDRRMTIGIFNTDNLLSMTRDLFQKYYPERIGVLVNQEKRLYSFSDGEIYKLDYSKHLSKKDTLPVKLIAIEKFKINDMEESLQKYKNVIYYFLPLGDIYIEN